MDVYMHRYTSPLGDMCMLSDGELLTGLFFEDSSVMRVPAGARREHLPVFDMTSRWLDTYFDGKIPDFTPPYVLIGTVFQRLTWEIVLTIPYGSTMTYGEVAKRFCRPMSAQAVGTAVGLDPICLVVPCHRVVAADGIGGYSGGTYRKAELLILEGNTQLASYIH